MIVLIYLFNHGCLIPLNLFCLITIVVLIYLFARLNLLVLAIITVHLLFITMKQTIIHDIHILFDETLRWRFIVVSLYSRSSNEAFPRHDLRRALFPSIKFVAPRTKKKKKKKTNSHSRWVLGCEAIIYLRSCALLVRKISGNNDLSSWSIHLWNFFFFFFFSMLRSLWHEIERERKKREREKKNVNGDKRRLIVASIGVLVPSWNRFDVCSVSNERCKRDFNLRGVALKRLMAIVMIIVTGSNRDLCARGEEK